MPIGYIVDADAHPHDGVAISLDLVYGESPQEVKTRRFHIRKEAAAALAMQMIEILAAPEEGNEWANIRLKLIEHCDDARDDS